MRNLGKVKPTNVNESLLELYCHHHCQNKANYNVSCYLLNKFSYSTHDGALHIYVLILINCVIPLYSYVCHVSQHILINYLISRSSRNIAEILIFKKAERKKIMHMLIFKINLYLQILSSFIHVRSIFLENN